MRLRGLLPHERLRAVDHLGRHLLAAVRRQAVQEDRVGVAAAFISAVVDREAGERAQPLRALVFLPHRRPHVGVDGVGAADRVVRDRSTSSIVPPRLRARSTTSASSS